MRSKRGNFEIGRILHLKCRIRPISSCLYLVLLCAIGSAFAQTPEPPALQFARPQGPAAPPPVITLQDALDRAKQVDAQYQLAIADATVAREDRIQARSALFPSATHTTQYLGTQGNGRRKRAKQNQIKKSHHFPTTKTLNESGKNVPRR